MTNCHCIRLNALIRLFRSGGLRPPQQAATLSSYDVAVCGRLGAAEAGDIRHDLSQQFLEGHAASLLIGDVAAEVEASLLQ